MILRDAPGVSACRACATSPVGGCLDENQRLNLEPSNVDMSLISHSRGSRMVFNVLAGRPAALPDADRATRAAIASKARTFFMAANQLSFLGVARPYPPARKVPRTPALASKHSCLHCEGWSGWLDVVAPRPLLAQAFAARRRPL